MRAFRTLAALLVIITCLIHGIALVPDWFCNLATAFKNCKNVVAETILLGTSHGAMLFTPLALFASIILLLVTIRKKNVHPIFNIILWLGIITLSYDIYLLKDIVAP